MYQQRILQQATTFYTEWLPPYIVREGFIDYIQEDIIETCKKDGKNFSSWENYLFRSYIPAVESPIRFRGAYFYAGVCQTMLS